MLSEEFIAAVEKAFTVKGFDLKVEFRDLETWDEAIFHTKSAISERGVDYLSYHYAFKVEFLLENGNLISIAYRPTPGDIYGEGY
ncbi:hypothetical protein [Thermovibrio ammonificans]|jgi:hypothetical protein|uniref:Uncharacterized protein n=1 Tax=Thermovibrio ammonificans (strain DSM 15698 / JCM 12110 / HB-1) TaxID=648996 RepID=E8T2Z1_THEA1|nr:hypothetical protein [Thermovibrio ammonificans]ADU97200.1 hypothetical protein Theam_1236 [Thermovibrio ammonificans HB-1]